MTNKLRWLLIVCFVMPIWAHACSLVDLEHNVDFAGDHVELPISEILSLTDWYQKKKESLGVSELDLFATEVENDLRSGDIARSRIGKVVMLIESLNADGLPAMHAHLETSQALISGSGKSANTIVVIVQPACAKTASCCLGQVKQ